MRVREETPERIVLTLTPWGPWLVACATGAAFLSFALLDPAGLPGWARAVFAGLGLAAPVLFLAGHARVHAVFSRRAGTATITRRRPIGGTSRQVLPLDRIAAVAQKVRTDADCTTFHQIELVLSPRGTRVALSTGPLATDQSRTARRLAGWLGVPAL